MIFPFKLNSHFEFIKKIHENSLKRIKHFTYFFRNQNFPTLLFRKEREKKCAEQSKINEKSERERERKKIWAVC